MRSYTYWVAMPQPRNESGLIGITFSYSYDCDGVCPNKIYEPGDDVGICGCPGNDDKRIRDFVNTYFPRPFHAHWYNWDNERGIKGKFEAEPGEKLAGWQGDWLSDATQSAIIIIAHTPNYEKKFRAKGGDAGPDNALAWEYAAARKAGYTEDNRTILRINDFTPRDANLIKAAIKKNFPKLAGDIDATM